MTQVNDVNERISKKTNVVMKSADSMTPSVAPSVARTKNQYPFISSSSSAKYSCEKSVVPNHMTALTIAQTFRNPSDEKCRPDAKTSGITSDVPAAGRKSERNRMSAVSAQAEISRARPDRRPKAAAAAAPAKGRNTIAAISIKHPPDDHAGRDGPGTPVASKEHQPAYAACSVSSERPFRDGRNQLHDRP